jgi:hypothetical protein
VAAIEMHKHNRHQDLGKIHSVVGGGRMSLHKKLSFIKSTIRLLGYTVGALSTMHSDDPFLSTFLFYAFVVLFVSEIIGVFEELGEM